MHLLVSCQKARYSDEILTLNSTGYPLFSVVPFIIILPLRINLIPERGVVAQRLEWKTLIHEVVGSNLAVVTLSVLPK